MLGACCWFVVLDCAGLLWRILRFCFGCWCRLFGVCFVAALEGVYVGVGLVGLMRVIFGCVVVLVSDVFARIVG